MTKILAIDLGKFKSVARNRRGTRIRRQAKRVIRFNNSRIGPTREQALPAPVTGAAHRL